MTNDQVIFYYKDGRLPFICPNNPISIQLQEQLNGEFIDHYEIYDPNAKPKRASVREKTYTQSEVNAMMEALKNPVKTDTEEKTPKKVPKKVG